MSTNQNIIEIELDPLGYTPRPDLFVRNLSPTTITFNLGRLKWELPPWPSTDYEQPLPWTVARSTGFERLWERGQVLVALDEDFVYPVTELPAVGSFRPYVHRQNVAQATTEIVHGLNRDGPVNVVVYSLNGDIQYYNFQTEMLTVNKVRVSFDDPLAFVATVF